MYLLLGEGVAVVMESFLAWCKRLDYLRSTDTSLPTPLPSPAQPYQMSAASAAMVHNPMAQYPPNPAYYATQQYQQQASDYAVAAAAAAAAAAVAGGASDGTSGVDPAAAANGAGHGGGGAGGVSLQQQYAYMMQQTGMHQSAAEYAAQVSQWTMTDANT